MKLDLDCVRDLLLVVEEFNCIDEKLGCKYLFLPQMKSNPKLAKYPQNVIAYTAIRLGEAGFIVESHQKADGGIYRMSVTTLTFDGHQYLEKIRNDENWATFKKVGSAVKDFSLEAIGKIAEGITAAAIDAYIKKNFNP